ncbi:MAG TPA: SrtB family sortase, partial [Pseudogracilibacillus sp.]|nr:SrtB family sortase [Pseudogracilibacillus sp.]
SMFQHLTKFLDKDFYNEHKTFEFETLYNSYEAEVFAVYQTVTDFDYIRTDFRDHSFNHYLNEVNETSMFDSDIEVTGDDQIITLSTCDYDLDPDEGRLVVQAKLTAK